MQCVSALHADRVREGQATRSSCVFSMRACLFDNNVCMCKRVVESYGRLAGSCRCRQQHHHARARAHAGTAPNTSEMALREIVHAGMGVSGPGHTPDDISVFDVWHISTVDMYFDISARILAYQWTFGISARILTYQPGFWHITRAPFRHLAYQKQQWEALRFDFVKHTGKRCLVPRR